MVPTPNLYDYDDYRKFLSDIFVVRQKKNPKYSMRKFGKDLDFSSPNHIADIIKGTKNLGLTGLRRIVSRLDLDKSQLEYLTNLVQLNHCDSDQERLALLTRLHDSKSNTGSFKISQKNAYFLTNRMCAIINILIDLYPNRFVPDPMWILRRTRVNASIDDIRSALIFMIKNKFISCENGEYTNQTQEIFSDDESYAKWVQNAHRCLLQEGELALKFPLEEREFASITASLPRENIEELKNRIKLFREDLHQWIQNKNQNSDKRLGLSINIQMYPITTESN